MAETDKLTTVVSARGQVPPAQRHSQGSGLEGRNAADHRGDLGGRPVEACAAFAATRPEEVFGILAYRGKPKTPEEMDASVLAEARRHDRD